MSKPKVNPIASKEDFLNSAPLEITINGVKQFAAAREFSSGSLGYGISGKIPHFIDGKMVQLQVSCNLTIVGTKPISEGGE